MVNDDQSRHDDAKLRVAFLLDSLGGGGAERSTAALLPHLRMRGLEPSVVLLESTTEGSEHLVREFGIPVNVLRSRHFIGRCRELHQMLRDEQIDVLHTALYAADQVGRVAALGTPTRVVSSLVTVPRSRRDGPVQLPRWKTLPYDVVDLATAWSCVDRFHAVTDGIARVTADARRAPRGRITTVERGRDPHALGEPSEQRRNAARERLEIAPDAHVLIGIGRQEPPKDYPTLVRAAARMHATRRRVEVLLVGRDASDTPRIERAIAECGLPDGVVRRPGHRDDVGDLLAAADVFVLSSRYEGAAGAVLEAMQLEVPIVATELDGLEGVLRDGVNALTVPVASPEAMAGAIERTLADRQEARRRAERARDDFERRFTIEGAADRMAALYRSVAEESAQRPFSAARWRAR